MEGISNYINGPLREYIQKKTNLKLEPVNISYDSNNKKLVFDDGEYTNILRKDYINVIKDIIEKMNQKVNKSLIESENLSPPIITINKSKKYKRNIKKDVTINIALTGDSYFSILLEEILFQILKNLVGVGYYDKFIKLSEIKEFHRLLDEENINQLLFYYLVPEYSNIKSIYIFDEINSWKHAFEVAYRNIYPPKGEDTIMLVRNKEVSRPIENAYLEDGFFKRIENVKYDNKGLPISFNSGFYDTHNSQRTDDYFRIYNYRGLNYTEYERKTTKWWYKHYGDKKFELLDIRGSWRVQTTQKKLMMYYRGHPKLLVPWLGINLNLKKSLGDYYLYKVIDIKWNKEYPTEIIAKYVGKRISNFEKLTIIPTEKLDGYIIKEIPAFQDNNIYSDYYLYWNYDTEKNFTYDDY